MMDNETSHIMNEADMIRQTLESEGWQVMARKLDEIIAGVCDIRNLTEFDAAKRMEELQRRIDAVSLLEDWLRKVKGEVTSAQDIALRRESINKHIIIK